MTDIVERLRAKIADAEDWNGKVLSEWDAIRATLKQSPGSDLPRLMFETNVVAGFTELLGEAADEIERLRAALQEISSNGYEGRRDYCHPEGCESPGIAKKALASSGP